MLARQHVEGRLGGPGADSRRHDVHLAVIGVTNVHCDQIGVLVWSGPRKKPSKTSSIEQIARAPANIVENEALRQATKTD